MRRERKPAFVHAKVIRPYSHSLSDDERLYKTPEEREAESRRDPMTRMRAFLLDEGLATDAATSRRSPPTSTARSPKPPTPRLRRRSRRPKLPDWYVFSPDVDPDVVRVRDRGAQPKGKPDTMVAAINRTLKDEMARNPRIVVFGEDVADASREASLAHVPGKGGVFKVTHGLQRHTAPIASSTRRSPKPTSSGARSAWPRAASSRSSRFSSSTTSGRR